MSVAFYVFTFCLIGTLGAWRPDIDINRVRLVPKETHHHPSISNNLHTRRSIFNQKNNDHGYNRGRISELRAPVRVVPYELPTSEPKAIKVHQPRQDPRLYYLSDAYAKKFNQKKLNNEISAIYNEEDVVRADSNLYYNRHRTPFSRLQDRESNYIRQDLNSEVCTKCPHDITLVAKAGADRVQLPHPRIKSCSSIKVTKGVRYEQMHGPKFGSLLTQGSYSIVGRITLNRKILRHCVMEVRVLTQTCPLPKYLVAHCRDQNKTCNFACRDTKSKLQGSSNLLCGDDNRWIGNLPICKDKSWCDMIPPPAHGTVSCKGMPIKNGLVEGSTCRVRCARGWKRDSRPFTSCRFGSWTNELQCVFKTNNV